MKIRYKIKMPDNKGFLYRTLEAVEDHIFATVISALVLLGVGNWTYKMYSASKGLEVKVGDYNGNNTLDKFYEINGQKVPVEVDGKPIIEYFKK